ncbi:F-box domain-containing protein [Caenorhabditis elegans]|uniref:F-box domain-containing protein n=1 Tax=Caenorhabditis elegans TaxID=6239 RepID=O62225_CAEEL|nr:F-box domain-containing protein [Caenorhabditis elegans]CAB04283.1 F-box domain-containing protein [Caenorhabditis elegans]|eukprot:NP_492990.1 Uncharacterized protein CELE_F35E2.2 [Caenorhabditis elegans]
MPPAKTKPKFPLCRLPSESVTNVLKIMKLSEIFNLSETSLKARSIVELAMQTIPSHLDLQGFPSKNYKLTVENDGQKVQVQFPHATDALTNFKQKLFRICKTFQIKTASVYFSCPVEAHIIELLGFIKKRKVQFQDFSIKGSVTEQNFKFFMTIGAQRFHLDMSETQPVTEVFALLKIQEVVLQNAAISSQMLNKVLKAWKTTSRLKKFRVIKNWKMDTSVVFQGLHVKQKSRSDTKKEYEIDLDGGGKATCCFKFEKGSSTNGFEFIVIN